MVADIVAQEEPNKIAVFGKSRSHMDVAVADFLPHEKELFVLIADADGNMHVLEYNPERKFQLCHISHQ